MQEKWQNLWEQKWTVRPEASGPLSLTAGQVTRWFLEMYKAEFEDESSPLHGLSAYSFQDIMNYFQKGVKPMPDAENDPQNVQETNLRREVLNIFLQDWMKMFKMT